MIDGKVVPLLGPGQRALIPNQAFAAYARDMTASLAARVKERPELAESIAELQKSLATIDETT
ncbi:MAG: hypothetical protein ABSG53_31810 [Thermoguttaceae bacterium]